MLITPVIITYNNPCVLPKTVDLLELHGFDSTSVCIIDNGSKETDAHAIKCFCATRKIFLVTYKTNFGVWWALNKFLEEHAQSYGGILLIMAHDALVLECNKQKILSLFSRDSTCFVTPQYPQPVKASYNIFRSYRAKPGKMSGDVKIGTFTAACARASILAKLRFDEEFFLYGGEFEIFLRAADHGYKSYVEPTFIVANPSTDASSEYGLRVNSINSLYLARKRHGWIGYLARLAWISMALVKMVISRSSPNTVKILLEAVLFSLRYPGKGYMTYHRMYD